MKTLKEIFDRNRNWADSINQKKPDFFTNLAKLQTPQYLWIGCSDSRVPANQIMDLPPGEVFVHRNIANLVIENDTNCLAVLEYAVNALKVEHIIICGHYDCGGVKTVIDKKQTGIIADWLKQLQITYNENLDLLKHLPEREKTNLLCELNVKTQVKNIIETKTVQNAWANKQKLSIHGWIYSLSNGILKDLETTISSLEEFDDYRNKNL